MRIEHRKAANFLLLHELSRFLDAAVLKTIDDFLRHHLADLDCFRVEAFRDGGNVMPVLVDAVKDYVSLGEISEVYRQVFGLYREPIIF